jgi:hypothetical protein
LRELPVYKPGERLKKKASGWQYPKQRRPEDNRARRKGKTGKRPRFHKTPEKKNKRIVPSWLRPKKDTLSLALFLIAIIVYSGKALEYFLKIYFFIHKALASNTTPIKD